jgi:hypothetical protein
MASMVRTARRKWRMRRLSTWNEAIGSLQLPFYLLLYSDRMGMTAGDLDAMFLLLGCTTINRDIELQLFVDEGQKKYFTVLEKVIFRLLGEIVDPEKPFLPSADKKNICPNCDYQYICDTQWIVKTTRN